MANKNSGEHTSHKSRKVLLLIDILGDFEFDDGGRLFENALPPRKKLRLCENAPGERKFRSFTSIIISATYMRGYNIFVPEDCVAAVEPEENRRSLKYLERVLNADIKSSEQINFSG